MNETYLRAIGLPGDFESAMQAVERVDFKTFQPEDPYRIVAAYDDPSGCCVGLVDTTTGFSTETFTVHGVGGHTVEAWQVMPGTAELNIYGSDGELQTRVLAFVVYPWYPLNGVGEAAWYDNYQIGAIAVDVSLFDSVEEWTAVQTPINESGLLMGPQFVTSPWLFALYDGSASAEQASPVAMFKAVLEQVDVVTNQLTGTKWYRAVADCGFKCALALPIDTTPEPHPGSVVDGKAFITGTTGFWSGDME